MPRWNVSTVAKAVAELIGDGYLKATGSTYVKTDGLRRQVEAMHHVDHQFDKDQRAWVDVRTVEILFDVSYPPQFDATGVYSTLGISINMKRAGAPLQKNTEDRYYPWPTGTPDAMQDDVWRDAARFGARAMMAVADPAQLVQLLAGYDTRQILDDLLIGQFTSVPHSARLIRALAITRLANLPHLETEVLAKIDRVWRTKGGAENLHYFATEYQSGGLQCLDDIAARPR